MTAKKKEPWHEWLRNRALVVTLSIAAVTASVAFGRNIAWFAVKEKVKCEIKETNKPVVDALGKIQDVLELQYRIQSYTVPDSTRLKAERDHIEFRRHQEAIGK